MTNNSLIYTQILTPDGLKPTPFQATSLAEAANFEPAGVYTVTRTYHKTAVLGLSAHLDRLEESAHLLNIPLSLDRKRLCKMLRQAIEQSGYPESRFRITIPKDDPASIYIAIERLNGVLPELRLTGVALQTFPIYRQQPKAKDNNWMVLRAELQAQMTNGIYEGLLTNPEKQILEGLGSNFYGILKGELRTAGDGILYGISRRIVMEVAPRVLPVEEAPITIPDIPHLDEAFITSSSRGVLAATQIDGHQIGDGKPGPLTRAIELNYNVWAEAHLEQL